VTVFGTDPTIDAVGKAWRRYLRTILSGGALYDLAEQSRLEDKASRLSWRRSILPRI